MNTFTVSFAASTAELQWTVLLLLLANVNWNYTARQIYIHDTTSVYWNTIYVWIVVQTTHRVYLCDLRSMFQFSSTAILRFAQRQHFDICDACMWREIDKQHELQSVADRKNYHLLQHLVTRSKLKKSTYRLFQIDKSNKNQWIKRCCWKW